MNCRAERIVAEAEEELLNTEHETYMRALYLVAKENGLSHDDCQELFGEERVADIERNINEITEAEKENSSPDLEKTSRRILVTLVVS